MYPFHLFFPTLSRPLSHLLNVLCTVLAIVAVYGVLTSGKALVAKIVWVFIVLALPIFGPLAYWLAGQ